MITARPSPRPRTGRRALAVLTGGLLIAGLLAGLPPASAADGQGFTLNASDLQFILRQIQISETHAAAATPADPCAGLLGTGPNQIPNQNAQGAELPWGLRTVDGTCNNLKPGQSDFGSSGQVFPRRAGANFLPADPTPQGFPPGNGTPTTYANPTGFVYDSQPREASNLVVDQTRTNPAAVEAWRALNPDAAPDATPPTGPLFIPNTAPDVGLSAPFNSMFTLFGQFFDHGLDLVDKSGGTVFVPLQPDDPLYRAGANTNFMVLTRATTANGPDGIAGNADDREATNKTTPFVDQSQTYTSHPSHQAFLREYALNAAGEPIATGRLLTGPGGGLATWADVKRQAGAMLGISLSDADVFAVPMLATDPYGRLLLSNGNPQIVTGGVTVETDPGSPVALPATTTRVGQAFLDDIAHNAAPKPGLTPDTNSTITGAAGTQDAGTYDDEMLNAHFVAGDGRLNENIGLTAVHHVFHSEHNRLTAEIDAMITSNPTLDAAWRPATPEADDWAYGERLFQAARFVTEMQYQHLAFEEFARKVQPQVNLFAGYDSSIDPAIPAEFAHAVYRFGHSMLTETVARRGPTGTADDIPLLDAFLNPPSFYEDGRTPERAVGDIVRGMTDQVGNEIDEFVTEALRNRLLGLPLDLATLNMARARDTGIPTLNQARAAFHARTNGNSALAPYANWIDFGLGLRHRESLINFVAAYGIHPSITGTMAQRRAAAALLVSNQPVPDGNGGTTPPPTDAVDFMNGTGAYATDLGGLNDVDLWLGGLAEAQSPFGGLLGSTFNYIFETSMEDLQDGDRFYYLSRTAGLNLLVQLEGNSFAELISRNSDAENLPADVFSRPDRVYDLREQNATGLILDDPATLDYDEAAELTRMADGTIRYAGPLHALFIGTAGSGVTPAELAPHGLPTVGTDRVRASEGDDTLRGNELDDRLEGGAGNDQLLGGSGQDVLTDTFGDDVLKGGDGNDAMSSGPGFDLNQGGLGNDFVVGGSDPTETFGGPGNDIVYAGDSSDTVFGDDGDDWLEGGGQADLVQGDNGAPFQDDPNTPGHDVLNGNGGQDDYDAEGGDDIMVSGPGIERNEGMLGFDWVTHKNDPQAADDDLRVTGLVPPSVDALRDRFDLVEALSGGNFADTLRGDDADAALLGTDHDLDAAGIARIEGLAALVAPGFNGGNILLGGEGSDLIEGRGGDDVIHGDWWLNVRLRAPNPAVPGTSQLVDGLGALRADVFAGRINPGDITIHRNLEPSAAGSFVDTVVFSGPRADYDLAVSGGALVVTHARGTLADGTDRLFGAERLRFADQEISAILGVPGAPTITSVTPAAGQALVAFTAPASDGGSPITSFEVQATAGGVVVATVTDIAATATSAVVTGLANGVPHTFTVRAVNALGAGPLSAPSVAVTPIAVPGAPVIGNATAGNTSATVRWTAPADNGGSPITQYRVQVRTGTTVVRTVTGVAPTATSTVVTGLTNGTAYNFRVRAVNAAGLGPLSAASNTVTPATVPGAARIGTAIPGPLGGALTAAVSWLPPLNNGGSAITGYRVRALRMSTRGAVLATTVSAVQPATARSLSMTLPAGRYRFTVQAINAIGDGPQSARSNLTPAL